MGGRFVGLEGGVGWWGWGGGGEGGEGENGWGGRSLCIWGGFLGGLGWKVLVVVGRVFWSHRGLACRLLA